VVQDGPTVHTLRRPHVTFRSLFPQLGGTIEASYLLLRRGTFPTCKRQVSGSIPLTGSRTRCTWMAGNTAGSRGPSKPRRQRASCARQVMTR